MWSVAAHTLERSSQMYEPFLIFHVRVHHVHGEPHRHVVVAHCDKACIDKADNW